ncbi:MAG: TIGR03905 family TSCPD domain-containing protein [Bacteroidales bacterium]|nr:TIGR03905 family TSCPD domain-containing protein [Bacteroidales bacterium]
MKQEILYKTKGGVCSKQIKITVNDETIDEVAFSGGCHGNTTGISALIKGMNIKEAIGRLEGINCRGLGTSCPDQLAQALKQYIND